MKVENMDSHIFSFFEFQITKGTFMITNIWMNILQMVVQWYLCRKRFPTSLASFSFMKLTVMYLYVIVFSLFGLKLCTSKVTFSCMKPFCGNLTQLQKRLTPEQYKELFIYAGVNWKSYSILHKVEKEKTILQYWLAFAFCS